MQRVATSPKYTHMRSLLASIQVYQVDHRLISPNKGVFLILLSNKWLCVDCIKDICSEILVVSYHMCEFPV